MNEFATKGWCKESISFHALAGSIPNGSRQAGFARFKEAAQHWIQHGRKITVQWVPSHMGIQENEKAEMEAKRQVETVLTAAGVKMFAEWAPKTELFQRKKGHEELAGL